MKYIPIALSIVFWLNILFIDVSLILQSNKTPNKCGGSDYDIFSKITQIQIKTKTLETVVFSHLKVVEVYKVKDFYSDLEQYLLVIKVRKDK